ncbi:hypothetical protein SEEN2TTA_04848 [Salmonella enterica subsp. enterica serovar Newport str. Pond080-2TTA]|nr:hypothetical protein SEEN2TTA_04848 [Salmonella enterica subsp. enterica serovar Newport str. Pond080-2TTA]
MHTIFNIGEAVSQRARLSTRNRNSGRITTPAGSVKFINFCLKALILLIELVCLRGYNAYLLFQICTLTLNSGGLVCQVAKCIFFLITICLKLINLVSEGLFSSSARAGI